MLDSELSPWSFYQPDESEPAKEVAVSQRRKQDGAAAPIGDRLLTLREAAEVLRLNPRTVREYLRRGELEGRLLGGRWRFRRKDLDRFYEDAPSHWDFQGNSEHGD